MTTDMLLSSLGLADLADAAAARRPFARDHLDRVRNARNPLAAATLADLGRRTASAVTVTHPWTLRVRAPGLSHGLEDPTRVSHAFGDLDGIPATEIELLGELPASAPLAHAVELVRSLAAARPDLPLRAFTAREIDALAHRENRPRRDVFTALKDAGLATLSWRPGCGEDDREIDVHRAAHEAGVPTVVPVGYRRLDDAFLTRALAASRLAADTGRVLSLLVLPRSTDGASPLDGTSGTEDWLACSIVRLALGDRAPRVTTDWHVVGHKLGATMLSCGADDVVAAQAAAAWAPPTDDGPRPLNPDRVRRWIVEARRSPVRRDAVFRKAEA